MRTLINIPYQIPRDGIVVLLFITAVLAGFGLGFVAGEDHASSNSSIQIEQPVPIKATQGNSTHSKEKTMLNAKVLLKTASTNNTINIVEKVVASKNGSKYYLISCSGAKRIHKKNRIWFKSISLATAKGYTPAKHCF